MYLSVALTNYVQSCLLLSNTGMNMRPDCLWSKIYEWTKENCFLLSKEKKKQTSESVYSSGYKVTKIF